MSYEITVMHISLTWQHTALTPPPYYGWFKVQGLGSAALPIRSTTRGCLAACPALPGAQTAL
eukprot:1154964-Pelagomonas_calceolata.AAC.5